MDIFIMHHNYRNNFLVVIDGGVYVHKNENCKFEQPFLSFQAKNVFIGKSKVCEMTEFFGAADNSSDFDGNTLLLQCENNEYVYISGLDIFKYKTDDKFTDYISIIGNNMVPYAFILREKNTYFLHHRYKFIENDKIEEGLLLKATNNNLDPYDYHVERCGLISFKKLEHSLIQTCWPGHGEDEENEDDVWLKKMKRTKI